MLIKKQTGRDHMEGRGEPGESGCLRLAVHEEPRCDLLHGLEQSLSVVLEGHDQLQLGATRFHG